VPQTTAPLTNIIIYLKTNREKYIIYFYISHDEEINCLAGFGTKNKKLYFWSCLNFFIVGNKNEKLLGFKSFFFKVCRQKH
jgi:hypothetical protein